MTKNKFLVIEGIEGAGKTEACAYISKLFKKKNILNYIIVREPGGTPLSEKLRQLIKYDTSVTKKSELLLIYAARLQLVETVIIPSLMKGMWVISDRYDLSSLAYQGGGFKIDLSLIIQLRKILLGNFHPSLTIYLDVLPEIGLKRIAKRKNIDKIEKNSLEFFVAVRNNYLELVNKNPNIITVNASETKNKVRKNIKKILYEWIN